jgi:hypothetical protein
VANTPLKELFLCEQIISLVITRKQYRRNVMSKDDGGQKGATEGKTFYRSSSEKNDGLLTFF